MAVTKKSRRERTVLILIISGLLIFTVCFYYFALKQNTIKETITLNGRQFIFSKKADVENAPVIIIIHGGTQNAETWFKSGNQGSFVKQSIREGYAIIAPDSLSPFCSDMKQWDLSKNSSDIRLFEDIFKWIQLRPDLNSDRVYVAGISMGGFMTSRLAQEYGDRINAVAIHSAGNADDTVQTNGSCHFWFNYGLSNISSNHPKTILIHGTNDSIIPYELSINYYYSLKNASVEVLFYPEIGDGHYWNKKHNKDILNWFNSEDL